jgi:hypothetical protein
VKEEPSKTNALQFPARKYLFPWRKEASCDMERREIITPDTELSECDMEGED